MITEIHPGLSIADDSECLPGLQLAGTKAVIHAAKYPCHVRFTGSGKLPKEHPDYLAFIRPFDLVLNMIDPDIPLFKSETFAMARAFARRHMAKGTPLIIHCNKGNSRAPSLALLIMAKDMDLIDPSDYNSARKDFKSFYLWYSPGRGIEQYMREHWKEL